MFPDGDPDGDGLTREQFRWLLGVSVALGLGLLLFVLALTGASHVWGVGGGTDGPPDASFAFETEPRDGGVAVTVTHEGPEAASPDELVVEVTGERRGTWAELGGEGPDVVGPGHSLVLGDVASDDVVRIYWEGGGGNRTLLDRGIVSDPYGGG